MNFRLNANDEQFKYGNFAVGTNPNLTLHKDGYIVFLDTKNHPDYYSNRGILHTKDGKIYYTNQYNNTFDLTSATSWGDITGMISNQTDLWDILQATSADVDSINSDIISISADVDSIVSSQWVTDGSDVYYDLGAVRIGSSAYSGNSISLTDENITFRSDAYNANFTYSSAALDLSMFNSLPFNVYTNSILAMSVYNTAVGIGTSAFDAYEKLKVYGKTDHVISVVQSTAANRGAYHTLKGVNETAYNLVTSDNTTGNRWWRWDLSSDIFTLQKLNDTGTSVSNTLMKVNSDGEFGVGIDPIADIRQTIGSNSVVYGDGRYNFGVYDLTTAAQGVGGGISFYGKYNTTVDAPALYAGIWSEKENTTNGNYSAGLHFGTRTHGGIINDHMNINSNGSIGVGVNPPTDIHNAYTNSIHTGYSSIIMPHNGANQLFINSNGYYSSSDTWKLVRDGYGKYLVLTDDVFRYATTTASGTAGSTFAATSKFEIDNDGHVGLGVTPAHKLHSRTNGIDYNDFVQEHYSSNANYYSYTGHKKSHTDTIGAHVATIVNEYIGGMYFYGSSNSGFTNGAYIHAIQDGAAGTTTPTRLEFGTADGSSSWIPRMIIDRNGAIGVGLTPNTWSTAYQGFQVNGISLMGNVSVGATNFIGSNLYYNTSNLWTHVGSDYASLYSMTGGSHGFYVCPSKSAGAPATLNYVGGFNTDGTLGLWSSSFQNVHSDYKHSIMFGNAGWMYSRVAAAVDAGLSCNIYVSTSNQWTIKNSGSYGTLIYQSSGNITFYHTSNTTGTATLFANAAFLRQGGLQMQNAVATPTHVTNNAQLYVTGGEMYVQDDSGNATQISPHNKDGEWIYNSKNIKTGKHININMEKMIRFLEEYHGETFIEEFMEE